MAVQLLPAAAGVATGVLFFSIFCLLAGVFTGFLVWVHRDRTSYVLLLAVFTTLGTLASIAQQIHTIVRWRDIKLEQYANAVANVGKPELAVAGFSTGADLALFYIQFACYNIEALLIFFWCAALLQSIFQIKTFRHAPRCVGLLAKLAAVLIPILLITVLQASTLQNNSIAFFLVANSCMAVGLTGSALMLVAILGRYIHTRRQLLSWHVRYGLSSSTSTNPTVNSAPANNHPSHQSTIYDRWLLLRFTIGFIALGIFQIVLIMFEVISAGNNNLENLKGSADLSLERAKRDFAFFIPGVLPPLLTFIVFGTTKPFREYMAAKFSPRSLWSRRFNRHPTFVLENQPVDNDQMQDADVYRMDQFHQPTEKSVEGATKDVQSSSGQSEDFPDDIAHA